jgi:Initiator Replication protein
MTTTIPIPPYARTLDAKPNDVSIVKPGELVDVVEMTPLTLTDRRIYNVLLANAWDTILEPAEHVIPKRDLQSTLHKGTDRLEDSIKRLMAAIVEVRVLRNGKWDTRRVQLLGGNSTPDAEDGLVRYDFHPQMREIIAESTVFARLHRKIMFALTSKYSLALYEMVQKRGNLTRSYEEFTIEELRSFMGVPKGKLTSWINFKNRAITPAVQEVSALSDFDVSIDPVKGKSKQFTGVRLSWKRKDTPDLQKVERELNYSKVGRKARMTGTVEEVTGVMPTSLPRGGLPSLKGDTLGKAKKILPGYDVYFVESEWRKWAAGKEPPANADAAFLAFCKKYRTNNPLS